MEDRAKPAAWLHVDLSVAVSAPSTFAAAVIMACILARMPAGVSVDGLGAGGAEPTYSPLALAPPEGETGEAGSALLGPGRAKELGTEKAGGGGAAVPAGPPCGPAIPPGGPGMPAAVPAVARGAGMEVEKEGGGGDAAEAALAAARAGVAS